MFRYTAKHKLTIGSEGVMQMISGEAKGPISSRTSNRNSLISSSSSSVLDSVSVTKAMIPSPAIQNDMMHTEKMRTVKKLQ